MLQKFFVNSIESKFIKQLLSTIPLPIYDTINFGDTIINGYIYIYKNYIVKCTKTGVFIYNSGLFPSDTLFPSEYLYPQDISAGFEIIGTYELGNKYDGITSIYTNKYQYYDVDTHIRLGRYLRCLRDIKGLDLMPFYNCFAYQILRGYYIKQVNNEYTIIEGNSPDVKCLLVPIKFNTSYTIAINCLDRLIISPVILDVAKNNYVVNHERTEALHEDTVHAGTDAYISKSGLSFDNPIKIRVNTQSDIYKFENQLYLLIQTSIANNSSLVVLETDAILSSGHMHFSTNRLDNLSIKDLTSYFSSTLSLLNSNDNNIYAFSDRLIEYLTLNAITNIETIGQNIYMAQKLSGFTTSPDCVNGVWDTVLRQYIYHQYLYDTKIPNKVTVDINGYIDKDVERYLYANTDITELLSIQVIDTQGNPIESNFDVLLPDRINTSDYTVADTNLMQYYPLDEDIKLKFNSTDYAVVSMKMHILNDTNYKTLAYINNSIWSIENPNKDLEIVITVKEI